MKISRRTFAKLGGIAALASLAVPAAAFGAENESDALYGLSADSFRSYIGTEFQVSLGEISFPAVLSDVRGLAAASKGGECFTLDFEAKRRNPGQERYSLSHFALGNFELMMVGNQIGKNSMLVATINRV